MFSPTGERGTIHLIDLQSVNLAGEDFLFFFVVVPVGAR